MPLWQAAIIVVLPGQFSTTQSGGDIRRNSKVIIQPCPALSCRVSGAASIWWGQGVVEGLEMSIVNMSNCDQAVSATQFEVVANSSSHAGQIHIV